MVLARYVLENGAEHSLVSMATDSSHRVIIGKMVSLLLSSIFDLIFYILASNDDIHKIFDDFQIVLLLVVAYNRSIRFPIRCARYKLELADYIFYEYLYRKSNKSFRVTAVFVASFAVPYAISFRICLKMPAKNVFIEFVCDSDSRYIDRGHMQKMQFFPFPKP